MDIVFAGVGGSVLIPQRQQPQPTMIDGRPALDAADVVRWFVDARCKTPSEEHVSHLARRLNTFGLLYFYWCDHPDLALQRKKEPSLLRVRRIAKALEDLCKDLPIAIEDAIKFGQEVHAYKDLLQNVRMITPRFARLEVIPKGRPRKNWHRVAQELSTILEEIGGLGTGAPTGKGIIIVQSALRWLGVDEGADAIFEALRAPRKRKTGKLK